MAPREGVDAFLTTIALYGHIASFLGRRDKGIEKGNFAQNEPPPPDLVNQTAPTRLQHNIHIVLIMEHQRYIEFS